MLELILKGQRVCYLILCLLYVTSCATDPNSNNPPEPGNKETLLEPVSNNSINYQKIAIPANHLRTSTIMIKSANIYQGPHSYFPMLPYILKKDDNILVLQNTEQWTQIYSPQYQCLGWIHKASITKPSSNTKTEMLDISKFPHVFAVHDVQSLYDTKEKKPFAANIKKGTQFILLYKAEKLSLIFIPESASFAYANNDSVQ